MGTSERVRRLCGAARGRLARFITRGPCLPARALRRRGPALAVAAALTAAVIAGAPEHVRVTAERGAFSHGSEPRQPGRSVGSAAGNDPATTAANRAGALAPLARQAEVREFGLRERRRVHAGTLNTLPPSRTQRSGSQAPDPIRGALETNPTVIKKMLLRADPRGMFLCGYYLMGRDGATLYLAATCTDYATGPNAKILSGSSLAFVATMERDHFISLEFPRQQTLVSDEERLFPPGVLESWRQRKVRMTPSEDDLLQEARDADTSRPGSPTTSSTLDRTWTPAEPSPLRPRHESRSGRRGVTDHGRLGDGLDTAITFAVEGGRISRVFAVRNTRPSSAGLRSRRRSGDGLRIPAGLGAISLGDLASGAG